jgi:hypothetical protein
VVAIASGQLPWIEERFSKDLWGHSDGPNINKITIQKANTKLSV